MRIKRSNLDVVFDTVLYIMLGLFCLTSLYPFVYLLSLSISSFNVPVTQVYLFPPEISFDAYKQIFLDDSIINGFIMSTQRMVVGTIISVFMTTSLAYPLSKSFLPNKKFWTLLFVFTMYFQGGMIPSYLLIRNIGLYNSFWALVLPHMINVFNLIIVRNFFIGIPESIEEAAIIDGANDIVVFIRIILPISLPIIATLVVWVSVFFWNEWFEALIYISDVKRQVLQNVMRRIIQLGSIDGSLNVESDINTNPENIKAATIMITTLPILLIYPFVQKYFVKGMTVGAVKG